MNGLELFERFCKTLENKGMSKKDFCDKSGIRQSALSNWGSRGTMPSADMALTIAKVLDVSVDYVLGNSDIPNPSIKNDITDNEQEIINTFRNLDDESKRQLVLMLAFLKSQDKK